MYESFRAVIFDLDGVIADSHPLHEAAWQALLAERGRVIPKEELSALIRQGYTRDKTLCLLFPAISASDRAMLGQLKHELYCQNSASLRPVPGVIQWIDQLSRRGVPMAVATSASRDRALDTLERFGIERYFQAVVTASEIADGKPHPALFLAAAEALAIEPRELLAVEDSAGGIQAARAAGMQVLFYCPEKPHENLKEPIAYAFGSDFTISEFTEDALRRVMSRLSPSMQVEART